MRNISCKNRLHILLQTVHENAIFVYQLSFVNGSSNATLQLCYKASETKRLKMHLAIPG